MVLAIWWVHKRSTYRSISVMPYGSIHDDSYKLLSNFYFQVFAEVIVAVPVCVRRGDAAHVQLKLSSTCATCGTELRSRRCFQLICRAKSGISRVNRRRGTS